MKRATLYLLAVGIAAVLLAPLGTEAGWFNKVKGGFVGGESGQAKPPRYNHYPAMGFHLGTLTRDGWTGWRLDELDIQLTADCVIESNGEGAGVLAEGRQAIVSGSRAGNTIRALRVTILKPHWDMGPKNYEEEVIWSESDRTVGVGHGPS